MFQFAFPSPLLPLPQENPAFPTPLFRLPKRSHHGQAHQRMHDQSPPGQKAGIFSKFRDRLTPVWKGDVRPLFQPLLRCGLKFTPVSGD